jgi:hypothetical protein
VLAWRGALLRLDGDTGLLLELGAIFIDDGPQLMQTLYDALDADDLAGVAAGGAQPARACWSISARSARWPQADRMSASLHDPAQAAGWRAMAATLGRRDGRSVCGAAPPRAYRAPGPRRCQHGGLRPRYM